MMMRYNRSMFKFSVARIGASIIGVIFVMGIPVANTFAASTIVQNNVKAFVACLTYLDNCDSTRAYVFVDPSISVQYQATVVDATGQVIPPGGSVSCGAQVTLQCGKHNGDDISWFSPGGTYDSPYGSWDTTGSDCSDAYYVTTDRAGARGDIYENLSLRSPNGSVSGTAQLTNCHTLSDGCSQTCTAVNTGDSPITIPAVFSYSSTQGEFYGSVKPAAARAACSTHASPLTVTPLPSTYYRFIESGADPESMWTAIRKAQGPTTITIPAASINYPITVTSDGTGPSCKKTGVDCTQTPNDPSCKVDCTKNPNDPSCQKANPLTLTAGPGTAACTIGTPYAITMSASGAQGTQVRYLIDWNNDGLADQIVPPSGYLPLGTPQTATRTYTTSGSKTVAVKAQDSSGNETAWTSFSFQCTPGDDSGGNNNTDNGNNGNTGDTGSGIPIQTDLTISVIPSLVGRGETTKVNWSSTNMTSCTVTATNNDTWSGLESPIGGETSSVISQETTYTLSCMGLDGVSKQKQATVNIVPVFNEQ